jgi:hypothetical protein
MLALKPKYALTASFDDLVCSDRDYPSFCSLALPEQVDALLNYVVREVPPESDDKTKFIYPYKASEVCFQASLTKTSIVETVDLFEVDDDFHQILPSELFGTGFKCRLGGCGRLHFPE